MISGGRDRGRDRVFERHISMGGRKGGEREGDEQYLPREGLWEGMEDSENEAT